MALRDILSSLIFLQSVRREFFRQSRLKSDPLLGFKQPSKYYGIKVIIYP
jgi:hypothetical protein